jgi:hypothetical protein
LGLGFDPDFKRPARKPPKFARAKKLERLPGFLRSRGIRYCEVFADVPTALDLVELTRNAQAQMLERHSKLSDAEWECALARFRFDPYWSGREPGQNRGDAWEANFIDISNKAREAIENPCALFNDETYEAIRSGDHPELEHPVSRANRELNREPEPPVTVTVDSPLGENPKHVALEGKPARTVIADWVQSLRQAKAMDRRATG